MRKAIAAACLAVLAMGLLAAAPAGAQDEPIPRMYPTKGFERPFSSSTEELARNTAAADTYEADCNRADITGCLKLGIAFETGQGRPQNRPVAELLYREACTGGAGEGCFRLGKLLRYADTADRDDNASGDASVSAELFVRACRMGWAQGCEAQADDLTDGIGVARDPAAARALLRATCEGGSARTCNLLAGQLILSPTNDADRDEGFALLDRQCRAGHAAACSDAAQYWTRLDGGEALAVRTFEVLGCDAGDGQACALLGTALMRGEWAGLTYDDPRSLALGYFERACTLTESHCNDAAMIRDEPDIIAACAGGEDRAACDRLVEAYGRRGGPLEDLPQTAALLGWLCDRARSDADVRDTCAVAGDRAISLLVNGPAADPPPDPARIEAHLTRACTAGSEQACEQLARELASGAVIAPDWPRAMALSEQQCEAGYPDACHRLADAIATEPDAPLLVAGGTDFPPPEYSPEELAEMQRAHAERVREDVRREREDACTTTEVDFRGQRYSDTICVSIVRVINAFTVKAGTAPWQALIWRPERIGRFTLGDADRVQCGGAVIRTGWILTAAHCLIDEDKKAGFRVPIITGGHRIRLGVYNPLAREGYSYRILRVVRHPDYKPGNFAFDIALIQYDPKGERLGDVVHPVARIRVDPQPMEERTIRARDPAYTYGWGRTALEGGGKPPSELRGARLELRDMENCTRITNFRDAMRGAVLCAAGARGEQACFGDSGGPLISYTDADRTPTVIGVVSAGVKCGRTGIPSRFTRIGHPAVRSWLNAILPQVMRR